MKWWQRFCFCLLQLGTNKDDRHSLYYKGKNKQVHSWLLFTWGKLFNKHYYSFKIFPKLWLAKSTHIIHHNQLLMTKFGRILCFARKWHKKCSLLQVRHVTEKTSGDKVELFWLWQKKWQTFHLFQEWELQLKLGELIVKNIAKIARRHLEGQHLLFGE